MDQTGKRTDTHTYSDWKNSIARTVALGASGESARYCTLRVCGHGSSTALDHDTQIYEKNNPATGTHYTKGTHSNSVLEVCTHPATKRHIYVLEICMSLGWIPSNVTPHTDNITHAADSCAHARSSLAVPCV